MQPLFDTEVTVPSTSVYQVDNIASEFRFIYGFKKSRKSTITRKIRALEENISLYEDS